MQIDGVIILYGYLKQEFMIKLTRGFIFHVGISISFINEKKSKFYLIIVIPMYVPLTLSWPLALLSFFSHSRRLVIIKIVHGLAVKIHKISRELDFFRLNFDIEATYRYLTK